MMQGRGWGESENTRRGWGLGTRALSPLRSVLCAHCGPHAMSHRRDLRVRDGGQGDPRAGPGQRAGRPACFLHRDMSRPSCIHSSCTPHVHPVHGTQTRLPVRRGSWPTEQRAPAGAQWATADLVVRLAPAHRSSAPFPHAMSRTKEAERGGGGCAGPRSSQGVSVQGVLMSRVAVGGPAGVPESPPGLSHRTAVQNHPGSEHTPCSPPGG